MVDPLLVHRARVLIDDVKSDVESNTNLSQNSGRTQTSIVSATSAPMSVSFGEGLQRLD